MKTPAKIGLLTSLYLSQGLPFGFFQQALPVLMRKQGLSLPAIGMANLLALPWALKFAWAPLVDRYGSERFGRRRGYILPIQIVSSLIVAAVALADPAQGLTPLMVGVFTVNLLAATQDIATDALAVDLLDSAERGLGNGVQVAGYRVGMILGGGLLLIEFERLGWRNTFFAMAAMIALATIPIALYREPPKEAQPAHESGRPLLAALGDWLRIPGALGWLTLLLVYKSGDALGLGMLRAFLVDRGLGMEDIGWLLGTLGFTTGLLGALAGGHLVNAFGRRRALIVFGTLQAFSIAGFAAVATFDAPRLALYAVSAVEHFTGGMATAALFTAMMDVCREHQAATDYTVQASVVVIATGAAGTVSGFTAKHLGYGGHFALASGLALAGVLYALVFLFRPQGDSPTLAARLEVR